MVRPPRFGVVSAYALAIAVLALNVLWGVQPAGGQSAPQAIPAGLQRYAPAVDSRQRDELYRQLREQAKVLEAQSAVLKTVAKLIRPTIVHIEADSSRNSFRVNRNHHIEEAGSGVIFERHGRYYVLTNRHVIHDSTPEGIKIVLADGRYLRPEQVLDDQDSDVAVLAISAPDLVAAPMGNSDLLEIGDYVLAVGSPFGLKHSVTLGIISAKGRHDFQLGDAGATGLRFQDFLQTDAAINPGNSGGPLVNLRGEVVGINTAIASQSGGNEGVGFAIPINMFVNVARQLIDHGVVTRAFMGVGLDQKFGPAMAAEVGLPRPLGARVNSITRGSPAEKAQIQVGDVVLEFAGTPVEDDAHLINLVSMTEVGKRVPVVVFRSRQTVQVFVEVGDSRNFVPPPQPPAYGQP